MRATPERGGRRGGVRDHGAPPGAVLETTTLPGHGKVRSGDDFKTSDKVDLGRLKAFRGSQNYAVPATVLLDKYKSVVIWCKEFDVLISPATLTAGTT